MMADHKENQIQDFLIDRINIILSRKTLSQKLFSRSLKKKRRKYLDLGGTTQPIPILALMPKYLLITTSTNLSSNRNWRERRINQLLLRVTVIKLSTTIMLPNLKKLDSLRLITLDGRKTMARCLLGQVKNLRSLFRKMMVSLI